MTAELFANDFTTTLASGINTSVTSATITTGLPADLQVTGQFRILVQSADLSTSEYMIASKAGSSTTLTITRGAEGSTPTAFSAGAIVSHVLTEGGLANTISNAVTAAVPAASTVTPVVDGTGAAGTGTPYARQDHVHPTDTTRAPLTPRIGTVTSSGTPTINTDTVDQFNITALAAAITSMTTNLSGSPVNGQQLIIRIKDNGTARAITWGSSFVSSGIATLLATTAISKTHTIGLRYDAAAAKWVCLAVDATGY